MKLTKLFIAVFLFGVSLSILAQNRPSAQSDLLEYIRINKLSLRIADEQYIDIDGNPYLYYEFYEGKLIVKTGETFQGEFRLDLYSNVIQLRGEEHIYALNFPHKIERLYLDGYWIQFIEYENKDYNKSGYFICLLEDKISLYRKKEKTMMAKQISKAYQQPSAARFVDKRDAFYLRIGDRPAIRIHNKKALLNLFPDHAEEIGEQIKREKIHFNNENDLVRLVNYLNDSKINSVTSVD
jgi:hypothetical protein